MRTFKSLLALGVAIMTLVEAQEHRVQSKSETTLITVHTGARPINPPLTSHLELKNTPINHRPYPPQIPNKQTTPKGPAKFRDLKDLTGRAPKPIYANPIQGVQAPPIQGDVSPDTLPSTNVTDQPKTLPNGPANAPKPLPNGPTHTPEVMPNGPAIPHTPPRNLNIHPVPFPLGPGGLEPTNTSTPITTPNPLPNGPANPPIPFPLGPGGLNPNTTNNNPPSKRDFYKLTCAGPNLSSKTRTCSKGSTDTDLTGYWCGANCKCDGIGDISCDAKKAPGCTVEVLSATCGAVVRDWKCGCVKSRENEDVMEE